MRDKNRTEVFLSSVGRRTAHGYSRSLSNRLTSPFPPSTAKMRSATASGWDTTRKEYIGKNDRGLRVRSLRTCPCLGMRANDANAA